MKFIPDDAPDMWLKAGVRVQGTFENRSTNYHGGNTNGVKNDNTSLADAYLRRVRFEVSAGFGHGTSYTMDIRNDHSNFGVDNAVGHFHVGDAYVKIKKPFDTSLINFKLFRSKIDVSRTETVKSARVIVYNRPYVADIAAQYISASRRAANIQMYGDYKKKFHYQIATGDSSSPEKITDASGEKAADNGFTVTNQSFFVGGKVRLSPFDGWEEKKRTETYFGNLNGTSTTKNSSGAVTNIASFNKSRSLINAEISAHYHGFFVQAEYFKFTNAVYKWKPATGNIKTSDSTGWYVTSEYVMPELGYTAPFFRYESQNRYAGAKDAVVTSALAGVNWYLKGNTIKAGIVYQQDHFGADAVNNGGFAKDVQKIRVTSQFFF